MIIFLKNVLFFYDLWTIILRYRFIRLIRIAVPWILLIFKFEMNLSSTIRRSDCIIIICIFIFIYPFQIYIFIVFKNVFILYFINVFFYFYILVFLNLLFLFWKLYTVIFIKVWVSIFLWKIEFFYEITYYFCVF